MLHALCMDIEALCAERPRSPEVIELQASAPSPTPTRTEEHIATMLGCGPAGHQAFAHADTRRGTHRHDAGLRTSRPKRLRPHRHAPPPRRDAGLQISRPRRQSARKMPRKPPMGLPHQQKVSNVQRTLGATMKEPCAWVGTSLARPGAPDCLSRGSRSNDRRSGLALVVQRSGKVRGSAGRDHCALQKPTPPKKNVLGVGSAAGR